MTADANSLTKGATEPATSFRNYIDALGRLGYDTERLLREADVAPSDLEDPDSRIACSAIGMTLQLALQHQRLNNLGMRIACETPIGAYPLIDYLVLTSESVGAGLEQLARYFRLIASTVALQFRDDHQAVRVVYDGPPGSLQYEFGITLCILHLREETEGRFRADAVSVTYEPDDVAEIERVLGCSVVPSASWNGWTMSREAWHLPLRRRDPILRGVLERQADEMMRRLPAGGGIALEVRQALVSRVAGGETRIEAVARALGVSVRSLQRKLSDEGQSYQDLVEATRKEAAGQYLANSTLSIGEVAYLLGYSEAAAFHRAFKRWNGMTPQDFRRRCS